MYGFIYITTNLINGKRYIGQHKGDGTDNYLGSGDELVAAIKKYGKENFKRDILCFAETAEQLGELERYYITLYDAVNRDDFYNIAEGGYVNPHYGSDNGMCGRKRTQQEISKMQEGKIKYFNDPENKKKHKKKMRELNLGEKNGNYGNKGEKAKNGKKVYQWQDKEHTILVHVFPTRRMALEYLQIKSGLSKIVKNNTLYKGYYWSF